MKLQGDKFILISSHAQSLINFRGDLIASLKKLGISVHVVTPKINKYSNDYMDLINLGVVVHQISLNRKGINPFFDLTTT